MRKLTVLLAALLILLMPVAALADAAAANKYIDENAEEKPLLEFFFENYCDSCKPENEFMASFNDLTGKDISDYRYRYYNVRTAANMELYKQALIDYGVPEDEQYLPMAIVDGVAYPGNSKIANAMPAHFTQNESTDSVIYYLYSPPAKAALRSRTLWIRCPKALR